MKGKKSVASPIRVKGHGFVKPGGAYMANHSLQFLMCMSKFTVLLMGHH